MRAMALSGSLRPGSCTTISLSPWRWMRGSATPNLSTLFLIVSRAWLAAQSFTLAVSSPLRVKTSSPARSPGEPRTGNSSATVCRTLPASAPP